MWWSHFLAEWAVPDWLRGLRVSQIENPTLLIGVSYSGSTLLCPSVVQPFINSFIRFGCQKQPSQSNSLAQVVWCNGST